MMIRPGRQYAQGDYVPRRHLSLLRISIQALSCNGLALNQTKTPTTHPHRPLKVVKYRVFHNDCL